MRNSIQSDYYFIIQIEVLEICLRKFILNTSVKNIERWIKLLRDDGKIAFVGSPKTGGYYVK